MFTQFYQRQRTPRAAARSVLSNHSRAVGRGLQLNHSRAVAAAGRA